MAHGIDLALRQRLLFLVIVLARAFDRRVDARRLHEVAREGALVGEGGGRRLLLLLMVPLGRMRVVV